MRRIVFPPVEAASEDGLVAAGGDLEIDTLREAYRNGIFPWPISVDLPLAWFSPDPRGVLFTDDLHLPKSFLKFLKKCDYKVTFNQAFPEVIRSCAFAYRKNQPSTWITPDIIKGYENLFLNKEAYSVEVWNQENELIGGIYGVCMGEFVSGESMFSKEINASKIGLYELMKHLKLKGIKFLDTQMVTSVVESFGGVYLDRPDFLELIKKLDWTTQRDEIF